MKKLFVVLAGVLALMLAAGCATTKPPAEGILGNTYTKLEPGPEGGAKLRWVNPAVDFRKYNKVMVDPISFVPSDEKEAERIKDVDPEQLRQLAADCNLAVIKAINQKYPVVDTPGPDVLRVRFGILDLKKSYPGFAGVTSLMPIGLGLTLLKRPITGTWTGGGSTVAQVLALDSNTNQPLAAAQDNYEAGFFERFSRYGSAQDAFQYWGEQIVRFLDEAHGVK